ncbi:sugar transporter [Labilibacter sediminis]|nr:sugar transporter [Labilibacter sediminis]
MIKRIKNLVWIPVIMVLLFSSCIPQRETLYLQDKEPEMEFKELTEITGKYVLQPNDYLFIQVSTFDPKISEFFNPTRGGSMQGGTNNLFMYMIDDDMNIDFPYAGKINLKGCNIAQAKVRIKEDLKPYLSDANLIVRLGTNYFTILGEVRSPGQKSMNRDQITIFEAIGLAGDLTVFGKKRDVKIVRPMPNGKAKTFVVDITDHQIVDSEYYYIYPNDFIYVRPMKAKQWGLGESFSIGIITSLLALGLTITTLTK